MEFLLSGIMERSDDALMALFIVTVLQIALQLLPHSVKKAISPMPVVEMLMRPLVLFLCDKLNREGRSDFALIIRGMLVFLIIFGLLIAAGIATEQLLVMAGMGLFIDLVLLMFLVSTVGILSPAYAVSQKKPAKGHYRHIAQSLNINMIPADEYGIRRLAIKAMVLSLIEWLLAPVLFFLIGGIPLACLYVSLSLFVRLNAVPQPMFLSLFGYGYRAMQFFAHIFASVFIVLSSVFSVGGKPFLFFKGLAKHGLDPLAAMAFTQNITLGGSVQNRHGHKINADWIGPEQSSAKITQKDVLRVAIQYGITVFLIMTGIFTLYVYGMAACLILPQSVLSWAA